MTDAKFDDCSKDGTGVIRYDQAYKITVFNYGMKTQIEMDTKLDNIRDLVKMAVTNGKQWQKVTWTKGEDGKLKKNVEVVLDHPENK